MYVGGMLPKLILETYRIGEDSVPNLKPKSLQRLLEADKQKMQVVGAVMHKLIRVIYGVLHSEQKFDPRKLVPQQA